jgi:hypothetical protein
MGIDSLILHKILALYSCAKITIACYSKSLKNDEATIETKFLNALPKCFRKKSGRFLLRFYVHSTS